MSLTRGSSAGAILRSSPMRRLRQQDTEETARERQHPALREQRAGDSAMAGAECGPHGELLMSPFRPHQEEVGDVTAGDQQDDADRGEQNPENLPDVADHVCRERADVRPQLKPGEHGRQERDHRARRRRWPGRA